MTLKTLDKRWWAHVIDRLDFVKSKLVAKKASSLFFSFWEWVALFACCHFCSSFVRVCVVSFLLCRVAILAVT